MSKQGVKEQNKTTQCGKKHRNATQTQRKIRKLKKVHIWPSIVAFLLSIFVAFISVATLASFFISYVLQQKFDKDLQDTKYIGTIIESGLSRGQSYDQSMEFLNENSYFNNAVAILGENDDELIAQHGDMTYDLSRTGNLELWGENRFYLDKESTGDLFDNNGQLMLDLNQMIGRSFGKAVGDDIDEDTDWMNQEIYNEPYWIVMPNSTFDFRILVRNELCLQRKDVLFICGIALGIIAIMGIPILFLFIHVLTSIMTQRNMYRLVSMDADTGGYNLLYFNIHAEKLLNKAGNAAKTYAVIHYSYRKYRSFCSCHGIEAGEALLQQINQYLSGKLKKKELCAHSADADFALLINCESREDAEKRVRAWIDGMEEIVPQCHLASCSGIYMVDPVDKTDRKNRRRHVDISQLYHNASIARDAISESEENGILFFDDEMRAQQLWEHHVEENMEKALEKEEFQVYLQPKYDPVSEKLAGAEALVRWINEEDGFISPGKFIPIFEQNGFVIRLDDYMISHVAALQMKWLEEGKNVVPVSVNVSRAHFTSPDLATHICELVDQYKLPHELLEIELTESAFFDDKAVLLQTVNSLKEFGFYVSMDDFGSGYSSLNSLKELPLDVLKLDAEFFRGKYEKERGEIVVSEAIQLAKNLNMKIVAEGIEEKEQVDFLAKLGCDMIQGFYFAKPMPASDFENKMAEDQ